MDGEAFSEPRIFVEVMRRRADGKVIASRKEISLLMWTQASFAANAVAQTINEALAEVGRWPPRQ